METMTKNLSDGLLTLMTHQQIVERNRDNLFSANHRRAMKDKYQFTQAEIITIGELDGSC